MICYEITHFIHSTLRKNKLIHLIEALLEDSVMAKTLLEALCDQFKTFLSKEHSDIFEVDRLKYVIYLNEFKSRIAPLSPDKQIPETDLHLHLLELYEIPKKRNNLFAILLVYFAFSK